jgi:peptidoglycan/LPS O-acetylase OafA/YrhL
VRPPAREHFPHLDAFRAFGATAVVATHVAFQTGRTVAGPFSGWLARLDFGVAVFFVISGFLLARPYLEVRAAGRPAPSTRRYLWRRAVRVLPAYWVVVVACLAFLPASGGGSPADWARYLTLTQIYGVGEQKQGLTQTWSLATEAAFYLVLPVLVLPALRLSGSAWRPGRLAALLGGGGLAVTVVWSTVVHVDPSNAVRVHEQWLPGFLSWFGLGIALAVAHVHLRRDPGARRWRVLDGLADQPWTCWVIATGIFAVATTPLAGPRGFEGFASAGSALFKNLAYLAAAGFLLLPAMFGRRTGAARAVLASRPLQYLGRVSYGIFLWHLLVLEIVVAAGHLPLFQGSFLVVFAVTWPVSVALAALSWHLLEQPLLRHRRRGPGVAAPAPTPEPAPRDTAAV